MKKAILVAENVTKFYGSAKEPILNSVSTEIYEGDFTVIMGSSGAGKSTLLYALSGMDKITYGQVLYKGRNIGLLSDKNMAALRACEFGFVFQQTHLVSNLTLLENVAVAGFLDKKKSPSQTLERAKRLLMQMNVNDAKDRLPSAVSGGEAQRAAIARAMINCPGLIFADEPTGALNRKNSDDVLNLLTALNNEGQSLLMVTHDIRAAIRGNRILYMEDGKIISEHSLSPYEAKNSKEREENLNAWLTSLSW